MGATFSSSAVPKQTPVSTPQRSPNCSDPRSPTKDIERTPIQVSTPIVNDENNVPTNSAAKEGQSRKFGLRQMMFERKKNKNPSTDE